MAGGWLVFYNEFGRRTMLAAFDQLPAAERPDRLPVTDCVPHCVDARLFHPLDRRQARERLFPNGRSCATPSWS